MFTGIIEEPGSVVSISHKRNLSTLKVRARIAKGLKAGDSVAVDGVCLTVAKKQKGVLSFDIMRETIDKTTLIFLKKGNHVNLERALRSNGRFDGHFVTGHVDDVATIIKRVRLPNYTELHISCAKVLAKYFVPKGSICIDGISLTVGKVHKDSVSIYLVPYTEKATTLGRKKAGDRVNIEADVLAKYILNKRK